MSIRALSAATVCVMSLGTAASAQSTPAEFPPVSFQGTQYIDSTGCAYIRAGSGGLVNWVPRLNRQREQLCGFMPTFASAAVNESPEPLVAAVSAPIIEIPQNPSAPIQTVAGNGAVAAPVQAETPVAAAAPVVAPAPQTLTFAQACEGRSGIQPGFADSVTGNPIDCGPTDTAMATTSTAAQTPRRVTLAEICTEIASTGQTFIDQSTGQPVACPTQGGGIALSFGLSAPTSNPVEATVPAAQPTAGYAQVWDDGRVNAGRGVPATAEAPVHSVAASSHRFVQVGTFAQPANAQQTAQQLQSLGLPVGFATVTHNGQTMQIVAAGPFGSAQELQRGLQVARSLGFSDAFTRR